MTPIDREEWQALCRRLGAQNNLTALYDDVCARYQEPHRHYHNLQHLRHCLTELEPVRPFVPAPDIVALALWFHDAIYDPQAHDNEARSTDYFRQAAATMGLGTDTKDHVTTLILATQHREPPQGRDAQTIVDIDLAILGQSPERFEEYERQIRAEYAWADDLAFARGREMILSMFLDRPFLYETPFFREKYENAARQNLTRSRDALGTIGKRSTS